MAGGELDEGSQKVQTSGCEINKYEECNVQHKNSQHYCVLHVNTAMGVSQKNSVVPSLTNGGQGPCSMTGFILSVRSMKVSTVDSSLAHSWVIVVQ